MTKRHSRRPAELAFIEKAKQLYLTEGRDSLIKLLENTKAQAGQSKSSKYLRLIKTYTKEQLIDLYKQTKQPQRIFAFCKMLGVNYSTLDRVIKIYDIRLKSIRAELERKGIWAGCQKGTKRSIETRKKQSQTRKRLISSGKIDCTKNIKAMCAKWRPAYKNTTIELALQEELTKQGIVYKTQERINFSDGHCCCPDIFIAPNICIFADGDYWHNKPGIPERDNRINVMLKSMGYIVHRFWEHEIRKDAQSCINDVLHRRNNSVPNG